MFGYTMKITYSNLVIFIFFISSLLWLKTLKIIFFWILNFNFQPWIIKRNKNVHNSIESSHLPNARALPVVSKILTHHKVMFVFYFHGNVFSEFLTFHNIDWLHIFNVLATLKCKVPVHATRNKSSTPIKHQVLYVS